MKLIRKTNDQYNKNDNKYKFLNDIIVGALLIKKERKQHERHSTQIAME